MKSVLLIGQSNMAGRGFLREVTPIYNENIFMLRNGRWQMMREPIHFDRSVAGAGPSASFALAWCNEHGDDQIGLIPCAEGGSSIDEWNIEGDLFRHAVSETKFAMRKSELIAILWHQGESDSNQGKYKDYYKKLDVMITALKRELQAYDVPFIVGALGDYLGKTGFGTSCVEYEFINQELFRYSLEHDHCFYVTAKGLTSNPDGIHINAISQRKLGLRYYAALKTRSNILKPLDHEDEMLKELYQKEHTLLEKRHMALERFTLGEGSIEEVMKFFTDNAK